MEYICIQSSLSNHRGLVPGPLKYTKSQVALVPYIKWRSICILPIFAYRLQQGMPTHHFIAGIQCSIQCMASSIFFLYFLTIYVFFYSSLPSSGFNYLRIFPETLFVDFNLILFWSEYIFCVIKTLKLVKACFMFQTMVHLCECSICA